MATAGYFNHNFEGESWTLAELMRNGGNFPFVAKTCFCDLVETMSPKVESSEFLNKEILLQRREIYKFAHIKVLPFYDKKVIERENGPEYVLEHENQVDKEFLLPLNYQGKFRFARRPGSRGRYVGVSQVIEDGQELFRVEETTKGFVSKDPSQQVMVKAKAVLSIKRRFCKPNDPESVLIECWDGKTNIAFRAEDRVNCTVIEDETHRNLTDLNRCTFFPRIVQFVDKVSFEDAVFYDYEMNSVMIGILEGPIEVVKIEEKEFVIGSVKDKGLKTMKTVLIPENLWEVTFFNRRRFSSVHEQDLYVKKTFEPNCNIDFLERSAYLVPTNPSEIIWLINPSLRQRNPEKGQYSWETFKIRFNESSDDEAANDSDHVYNEIDDTLPPVPKRTSVSDNDKKPKHIFGKIRALLSIQKKRSYSLDSQPKLPPNFSRSVSHEDGFSKSSLDESVLKRINFSENSPKAVSHKCPEGKETSLSDEDNTGNLYDTLVFDGCGPVYEKAEIKNLTDLDNSLRSVSPLQSTKSAIKVTEQCKEESRNLSRDTNRSNTKEQNIGAKSFVKAKEGGNNKEIAATASCSDSPLLSEIAFKEDTRKMKKEERTASSNKKICVKEGNLVAPVSAFIPTTGNSLSRARNVNISNTKDDKLGTFVKDRISNFGHVESSQLTKKQLPSKLFSKQKN